jgi:hypothetical protein
MNVLVTGGRLRRLPSRGRAPAPVLLKSVPNGGFEVMRKVRGDWDN